MRRFSDKQCKYTGVQHVFCITCPVVFRIVKDSLLVVSISYFRNTYLFFLFLCRMVFKACLKIASASSSNGKYWCTDRFFGDFRQDEVVSLKLVYAQTTAFESDLDQHKYRCIMNCRHIFEHLFNPPFGIGISFAKSSCLHFIKRIPPLPLVLVLGTTSQSFFVYTKETYGEKTNIFETIR